jgi:signal transduction histidine kinase
MVAEELALRSALAIDNARLYEAEREAVKRREQVVEAVAHDLKNPLTSIRLSAELVEKKPSFLENSMKTILESINQMETLIFDLLDLSKIDSGMVSLKLEDVELSSLVGEIVAILQPMISQKQIRLSVDISQFEKQKLKVDRSKSLQILSNIMGNAVKFTPQGGEIKIDVSPFTDRYIQFKIADSGPGIDQESLPFVFDRFWKKPQQRTQGAGLGLSIAKAIVEAHGGMIWVESQVGEGTCFYFTLPLSRADEAETPQPPQIEKKAG